MQEQPVELEGEEGPLRGRLFTAGVRAPLVVVFRGVAFARPNPVDPGYRGLARDIAEAGFAVLFVSFRGTDDSPGFFSMQGWERDAQVVMEHAFTLGFDRMGLVGASAGGATALRYAAQEGGIDAVATLASPGLLAQTTPRSSMPDFMSQVRKGSMSDASSAPVVPPDDFYADLVAHDPYPVIGRISPIPLLLMQGDADHYVSVGTAQRLFEAAREPKELVIIPGAGHVLRKSDTALATLKQWLKQTLAG